MWGGADQNFAARDFVLVVVAEVVVGEVPFGRTALDVRVGVVSACKQPGRGGLSALRLEWPGGGAGGGGRGGGAGGRGAGGRVGGEREQVGGKHGPDAPSSLSRGTTLSQTLVSCLSSTFAMSPLYTPRLHRTHDPTWISGAFASSDMTCAVDDDKCRKAAMRQ